MGKHANTYQILVSDKLASLGVGESFSKKDFIKEHWEEYNYFVCRSFDVILTHAKKKFPEKEFRCIKRFIHRLK